MNRKSAPGAMELVSLVITGYAGITRGRSLSRAVYEKNPAKTLGWAPANMSLTPFDLIADPNPWGSRGDLRLQADAGARFRTALPGATAPAISISTPPGASAARNVSTGRSRTPWLPSWMRARPRRGAPSLSACTASPQCS